MTRLPRSIHPNTKNCSIAQQIEHSPIALPPISPISPSHHHGFRLVNGGEQIAIALSPHWVGDLSQGVGLARHPRKQIDYF
jgi:hypothetical protein